MREYIAKDTLIKTTRETQFTISMGLTEQECKTMNKAKDILADAFEVLPASDVIPVLYGKDISDTVKGRHCEFKCSICGKEVVEYWGPEFISCPYCGVILTGNAVTNRHTE